MKASRLVMHIQNAIKAYGDKEVDILVEDLSPGGFGQIEQEVGDFAVVQPGHVKRDIRFKILSKDFT